MENYLLCGELQGSAVESPSSGLTCECTVYKGRRKGTVEFVGIWKQSKLDKKYIENGVQIMHCLDHQNVLKFIEWYETPQHIWVITELAIGGSLADILEQDGFIPSPNIDTFVGDIFAGLSYIHSKGILYCDLQPAKIVLDGYQSLKLSDFTLAKSTSTPQNHYDFKSIVHSILAFESTNSSTFAPSPFYAAPELFDQADFSPASDLWSLGCVVYELSVGSKPFDCDDPKLMIHSISSVELNSDIQTLETSQLISKLLAKDPSSSKAKEFEESSPTSKSLSVLLLNGPFAGHLFPLLGLGQELVFRGHNVTLCSTVMNGSKLLPSLPESVGVTFLNAGYDSITQEQFDQLTGEQKENPGGAPVGDYITFTQQSTTMVIDTLESVGIDSFDIIVCDFSAIHYGLYYAVSGRRVVAFSSMLPPYPAIESPWPIPFTLSGTQSEDLSFLDRLQNSLISSLPLWGWSFLFWSISKADKRLRNVLCESEIDFMRYPGTNIPHLITSVVGFDIPTLRTPLRHYVGPIVNTKKEALSEELENWLSQKKERSVVYISMGTTGSITHEAAATIIESVLATELDAVWALKDRYRHVLDGFSIDEDRIYISGWVPQQTVLAHKSVKLTILHCGLNSVQESLYNGLPVVCLPHAFDHFATGGTIRNIGVGISMYSFFDNLIGKSNVSTDALSRAIQTASSDTYVKNAQKLSIMYKFAGGSKAAAELVEFYEDVGYDDLIPAFARYKWSWVKYHNLDVYCLLTGIVILLLFCSYKCLGFCCR